MRENVVLKIWYGVTQYRVNVEEFSGSYYMTEVDIVPSRSTISTINERDYQDLQCNLYEAGTEDTGIFLKVQQTYIEVEPDRGTPSYTVHVPKKTIYQMDIGEPPTRQIVLVPKPWVVRIMRGWEVE